MGDMVHGRYGTCEKWYRRDVVHGRNRTWETTSVKSPDWDAFPFEIRRCTLMYALEDELTYPVFCVVGLAASAVRSALPA